ncbi:MAG: hypothetical protein PHW52_03515 [Candidatus Pacebacteria bacterium]|nr:hypothetical protein [Candidatus Paceibacterota bacterium]
MENENNTKEEIIEEKLPGIKPIRNKDTYYSGGGKKSIDFAIGVAIFLFSCAIWVLSSAIWVLSSNLFICVILILLLTTFLVSIVKRRRFIAFGLIIIPSIALIAFLLIVGSCFYSIPR